MIVHISIYDFKNVMRRGDVKLWENTWQYTIHFEATAELLNTITKGMTTK